jgi:outer membrane murein-binding lipoprotein Lpp
MMNDCDDCAAFEGEISDLNARIADLEDDLNVYRAQYEKLSEAVGEIACPISEAISCLAQADKAADRARGI